MTRAELPRILRADFEKISRLAYEQAGLNLPPGKEALVSARLGKEMRRLGFESFADYYQHLRADSTGQSLIGLLDALTTNYTSFLREPQHFDLLTLLATTTLRQIPALRIWSAACSSGEEPYSIAMALSAVRSPDCAWTLRILATDISTRVLDIARRAIYPAEKFQPLPQPWMRAFLLKGTGDADGKFQIKPEIRALVEFDRANLLDRGSPGEFQFVFCRNAMIYFDRATQQRIVHRLAQSIVPGGYLFIGHSETLNGFDQPLRYVRPAVYRKETRA